MFKVDLQQAQELFNIMQDEIEGNRNTAGLLPYERNEEGSVSRRIQYCGDLQTLGITEYCLKKDRERFKGRVGETVRRWRQLCTRTGEGETPGSCTYWDFQFAETFCLFVAMHSFDAIRSFSAESDYDPSQSRAEFNETPEPFVCRLVRAFFLGQDERLAREVSHLDKIRIPRDGHTPFRFPRPRWRRLFESVFEGRERETSKEMSGVLEWYEKQMMIGSRGYPGGIPPIVAYNSINYPLLALYKIATVYKKLNLEIDSQFIPKEVVFLG